MVFATLFAALFSLLYPLAGQRLSVTIDRERGLATLRSRAWPLQSIDADYQLSRVVDLGNARVRVLPLERILVSKRAANRDKDRIAIAQIEQTLKVLGALEAKDEPEAVAEHDHVKGCTSVTPHRSKSLMFRVTRTAPWAANLGYSLQTKDESSARSAGTYVIAERLS